MQGLHRFVRNPAMPCSTMSRALLRALPEESVQESADITIENMNCLQKETINRTDEFVREVKQEQNIIC